MFVSFCLHLLLYFAMQVTIQASEANQRFDRFLRKYFKPNPDISLITIYAWIRTKKITVNWRKAKEEQRLHDGDVIQWADDLTPGKAFVGKQKKVASRSAQQIEQLIIEETENWIIRNKPPDMVTHPGPKGTTTTSLHDIMQTYLHQTKHQNESPTFHPAFCFRLDKDTSGVIISAKTYAALQHLNEKIRLREVSKTYMAIVLWAFPKSLTIEEPLFKGFNATTGKAQMFVNHEKGVDSHTQARNEKTIRHPELGTISLVRIALHTGRMHQIRVHLAHAWYPVLGDITYGNSALNRIAHKQCNITRQLLHSLSYWFFDPFSDTQRVCHAPLPGDFDRLMNP